MFCSYFKHVGIKALWCSGQKMCSQTSCTSRIFSAPRFITSLVLWHSGTGSLSTRWGQKRCDPAAAGIFKLPAWQNVQSWWLHLPGFFYTRRISSRLCFGPAARAGAINTTRARKEVTRATACNRFVFSPCANRQDARHRYLGRCDMSSVA